MERSATPKVAVRWESISTKTTFQKRRQRSSGSGGCWSLAGIDARNDTSRKEPAEITVLGKVKDAAMLGHRSGNSHEELSLLHSYSNSFPLWSIWTC